MGTTERTMLELFSGTGSVGGVFREAGWKTVSLDRDMTADIRADIRKWDYKTAYPPKHFYFVRTLPPPPLPAAATSPTAIHPRPNLS